MLASSFLLYCFCKCYTFKHLVKPDTFVSIEIHAYCSDIIRYNANCFSKDCSHAQFCNLINFNVSSKIKNKRKKEKKKEMVLRCNRKQDVVLWQTRKQFVSPNLGVTVLCCQSLQLMGVKKAPPLC